MSPQVPSTFCLRQSPSLPRNFAKWARLTGQWVSGIHLSPSLSSSSLLELRVHVSTPGFYVSAGTVSWVLMLLRQILSKIGSPSQPSDALLLRCGLREGAVQS